MPHKAESAPHDEHYRKVKSFHDCDAAGYAERRYGTATVRQLSYIVRRDLTRAMTVEVSGDILDIGCGPGTFLETMRRADRRLFAVDLSVSMVALARRTFPGGSNALFAFASNVTQLGIRDNTFDAIICIGVVGYVPEAREALDELWRVLKPGGVAVLQTANARSLREILYERWVPAAKRWLGKGSGTRFNFPVRPYSKGVFERMLTTGGFEILEWRYYDFHIPFLERLSMDWAKSAAKYLQRFSQSRWLNFLGSGYLVKVRKK